VHDAGQVDAICGQIVGCTDACGVRGQMVFWPYGGCEISFSVEQIAHSLNDPRHFLRPDRVLADRRCVAGSPRINRRPSAAGLTVLGAQYVYRCVSVDLTPFFADPTVARLYEDASANGIWVLSAIVHFSIGPRDRERPQ
jgi:hypothetical protein